MAEVEYQQPGQNPGIESVGIHIPDETDMGSGTFTVTFEPNCLTENKTSPSEKRRSKRWSGSRQPAGWSPRERRFRVTGTRSYSRRSAT